MDFNFRAPSPMFKEMNRLESPSLFFDDFKVDVNVSPSRFFTTTPPLWSPTKSLQESSSPTKSLLTNESPTFNCFVDNIQPNGLIPFKPQVVKLEDNPLGSIERPNVSTTEEGTQQQKNSLLNLESKGGAFEKFNKPGLDINSNNQTNQNSFLNSAFSKIENSINIPEPNPLIKMEQSTTNNNPNPTNMTNNNNVNNNVNNTNNNNNNVLRNNNNPPGISNNSMFNNLSQQNKNMPNPFFPNNDFSGMNLMFAGGPNSAFSKMDNMPLFNQSLMTNGFPSNNMGNMGNMGNMKQGQGFHPNMMQMNPAMMQMMQMQMQMQNPNLLNINPNNIPNNNNGNNTNNNNNLNNLNNLNNNNNINPNNNNLNNMNNNNMKQMGGGDSRFIKFESIVPMMNPTDTTNKPNMNSNMNPSFNNMNPNMFFSVPTNPNMNSLNVNLNPNLNGNFLTRAKNPLEQSNEEKSVPNKRQKNKKTNETKNTKNKDNNKHIKPKFTTEVNKNDLDLIQKKRTLDTQSPTFTDDGHLKNRVKEKKEVPDKIQCLGSSKKKGTQCKNAALLEYIGPRPLYCAEHIEEDKNTLHGKCKCTYFKEKGDGKPCKQIILKELVMCYRHFDEVLPTLTLEKARRQKNLVVEMIKKLRQDSKTFLKTNIDLYQRKSKLLPKYIKLDNILAKFIAEKEKTE